jgi:hypothetical protein
MSSTIGSLAKAMSAAFAEIESAKKDKQNPHFKSWYADLASVVEAIKPALKPHGLWFSQISHNIPDHAAIETIIIHSSGETMSTGIVAVPVSKRDAQGFGSALTYARRYSLSAAVGVCGEDDDGNAATKAAPKASLAQESYHDHPKRAALQVAFKAVDSMASLQALWGNLSPEDKKVAEDLKNETKERVK